MLAWNNERDKTRINIYSLPLTLDYWISPGQLSFNEPCLKGEDIVIDAVYLDTIVWNSSEAQFGGHLELIKIRRCKSATNRATPSIWFN